MAPCKVHINVGLSAVVHFDQVFEDDDPVAILFDYVREYTCNEEECFVNFKLILGGKACSRGELQGSVICSLPGNDDCAVQATFVRVLAKLEPEHVALRGRHNKEFDIFAFRLSLELPAVLQPTSLIKMRSRHLHHLPRDVEVLDAKTFLMVMMQAKVASLRDEYAQRGNMHPRLYSIRQPFHSLFDRAVRTHSTFLGSLESPMLLRQARRAIKQEIAAWISRWGNSKVSEQICECLEAAVIETEALGFFI